MTQLQLDRLIERQTRTERAVDLLVGEVRRLQGMVHQSVGFGTEDAVIITVPEGLDTLAAIAALDVAAARAHQARKA